MVGWGTNKGRAGEECGLFSLASFAEEDVSRSSSSDSSLHCFKLKSMEKGRSLQSVSSERKRGEREGDNGREMGGFVVKLCLRES